MWSALDPIPGRPTFHTLLTSLNLHITMTKGFTLIELLLVVVIIGIVAAFVLPKFGDVKEKTYVSAMKNDLRNLASAQEVYFSDWNHYIPNYDTQDDKDNLLLFDAYTSSEDVEITYTDMTTDCTELDNMCIPKLGEDISQYYAQAEHAETDMYCVFNGSREQADIFYWNSKLSTSGKMSNVSSGEIECEEFEEEQL